MKKNGLVLMALLMNWTVFAQSKPVYTQYVLNNFVLNPALAGIENYTDVKLSHRAQWVGIKGAPTTTYFSLHAPIGKTDYNTTATSFEMPGNNPRGEQYWQNYTAPNVHQGLGITAINEQAGFLNRWSVQAAYAYHQPLGVATTLALGFSAGVSSVSIDQTKIDFADLDPNDPAIGYTSGELKKVKPEIGVGLWLYSANYFAGLSILNIVPGKTRFVADNKYGTYASPNYFLTAGYRIALTDQISALPSVMVQYWQPQLYGVHTNVKLQYLDQFWVGGSYRFADVTGGYSAMAGFNLSHTFNISYAYENATNASVRSYTGNTHELVLGFLLGNHYGDNCPRNVW